MNVSVVWSMSNAWRIQVKGKDLVRTAATLADFQARPGLSGMPLLAPFANRLDETSDGALEVHTRLDNLSNESMPVVIGYHPIFELPDGNRDDWTVSVDAKTHWIEIPQRLPTGETQPIENFFNAAPQAIQLKNYGLRR
jgi:galactose mutarotase-like enzyme